MKSELTERIEAMSPYSSVPVGVALDLSRAHDETRRRVEALESGEVEAVDMPAAEPWTDEKVERIMTKSGFPPAAPPLVDKKLNREVFREMVSEAAPSTPAAAGWYQEAASCVRSIASRIGSGRLPESIRDELRELANQWEAWSKVSRPAAAGWSGEAIPSGVAYGVDGDNFYDMKTRDGMGTKFWEQWKERRDEFPVMPPWSHPDAAATPGVGDPATCEAIAKMAANWGEHLAAKMIRGMKGQPLPDGGEGAK